MAKDPIKKATNGTYYFRANLGYNPITGKQIQKYRSGFRTKKEAKEEYSKLVLASTEELTTKKDGVSFQQFIEETYLPWYKTQASIRTIYIDSDTLNELKAWQSVQQQVLPDCSLVLSYNGTPTSKTTLPRALEKLSNLAGVHRIKIHALRHSHASLLISMGENPLLIKERLGHEKIQTTLGTYGHLYPNTNLEVAKKLTGILQVQSATESIANYTSNQHTAIYHKTVEEK